MTLKARWFWEIYFVILALFVFHGSYAVFSPKASAYFYYHVLYYFDPSYRLTYFFACAQAVVGILSLVMLFLYIHRIRFLNPPIWQTLFILRIIFDLFGHAYEVNYLVSLLHSDPKIFLLIFVQSLATYIPSYVACYRYAFRQDKIFSPSDYSD